MTFGPSAVSIRPTYRKPRNGCALGRHPGEHRPHDLVASLGARRPASRAGSARTRPCRRCSDPGRRRRCACDPARSRAARTRAVGEHEERHFWPDEELLEHDAIAGVAERPIDHRRSIAAVRGVARSSAITTPLPAARPSAFITSGKPNSPAAIASSACRSRVADAKARGRHAVARHEVLRERLARLEARGRLRRTDDRAAVGREHVDDAATERQLRVRRPSGRCPRASASREQLGGIVDVRRHTRATAAMPGFPGAHRTVA